MWNRLQKKHLIIILTILAVLSSIGGGLLGYYTYTRLAQKPIPVIRTVEINPWKEAISEVEQNRNEPAGYKASVNIPAELRQYGDPRRFLAIQVAETKSKHYEIPRDFADLASMIRTGQFVEMNPLGDDYILYGIGENLNDGIMTHYDEGSGLSIPLYSNDAEYLRESIAMADSIKQAKERVSDMRLTLSRAKRTQRELRKTLNIQIAEEQKNVDEVSRRKDITDRYYKDKNLRALLRSELQELLNLAADFGGKKFDLGDTVSRRQFKVKLLSVIRPEAKAVIEEIAKAYHGRYSRHLPITSLVRPIEYQRLLSETNPNATRIAVPPHATGLAFDVYYFYMSAGEQEFLMGEIARLKRIHRVEAIRERRDNIHVFAFPDGKLPAEITINAMLPQVPFHNKKKTRRR